MLLILWNVKCRYTRKGPKVSGKVDNKGVGSSNLLYFIQMMCALQSDHYIMWMKKQSMTFSLESESRVHM